MMCSEVSIVSNKKIIYIKPILKLLNNKDKNLALCVDGTNASQGATVSSWRCETGGGVVKDYSCTSGTIAQGRITEVRACSTGSVAGRYFYPVGGSSCASGPTPNVEDDCCKTGTGGLSP
ncbi:MAG: hypothetical protein GY756_14430 [bacterium]|nr:hypothetical protein [bacterium]